MSPQARTGREPAGAANAPNGSDASGLTGRSMPQSLEAEAAVLGSMIIDPVCIGLVIQKLDRTAFYRVEHQMIFDALVSLYETSKGTVIDGVLLQEQLRKRKQLESVGGAEYLAQVVNTVPSAASIGYYSDIVKEKQLLRELIVTAGDILEEAYDQAGETSEKLDEAERKIFSIVDKKVSAAAVSLGGLAAEVYDLIEKREGSHVTGLASAYHELNELTCGFQTGEMIIIAGRPSMGKTAFVLNLAEHLGIVEQEPVAIFSLEMGKQQLAERFLCSYTQIDANLVRKGMLSNEQYHQLAEAVAMFAQAPIYIDDTPALTPLEMRAKARRLKHQYGIKCLIVDYLQLMHMGGRPESRQQEITAISRQTKALARELEIPVLMLSQLNRAAEGREDHRPRMSDLRESGSIEQDADVIMLLHREDYYRRNDESYEPTNVAEVIIAKQRNGPTGTVKLMFREESTRFENLSHIPDNSVPF